MPAGVPGWVYVLGPVLVLLGGGYAAYLGRRSAKGTNKQITQSDIINQIQEERNLDKDVISNLNERVVKLEKLSRIADEWKHMALKYMYQQDMWIIKVYDSALHPVPPTMPVELKEQ